MRASVQVHRLLIHETLLCLRDAFQEEGKANAIWACDQANALEAIVHPAFPSLASGWVDRGGFHPPRDRLSLIHLLSPLSRTLVLWGAPKHPLSLMTVAVPCL
jgi:hypothetical protein